MAGVSPYCRGPTTFTLYLVCTVKDVALDDAGRRRHLAFDGCMGDNVGLGAGGVKANVLFFDRPVRPREGYVWTETLWVYDFRVAHHFTLKQRPLRDEHLAPFLDAYRPGRDRAERTDGERWKPYRYDDLVARDKANLDITWLKDPSLTDAGDGVSPEIIAREIVEDLQSALLEFEAVAAALEARAAERAHERAVGGHARLTDTARCNRASNLRGSMHVGGDRP